MKVNWKKLRRNANIGDKLDLVPLIIIIISLFGIGIFYTLFRAGVVLSFFPMAFFAVTFVISLILYGIGRINSLIAEKTAFNYIDEVISGVVKDICRGGNIAVCIDMSIRKPAILFTFTDGRVKAVCDFTPANKLPQASTTFLAVCLGLTALEIRDGVAAGVVYNDVSYDVVINGSGSPRKYFVLNGTPDEAEIDSALRIYKKYAKKYKKRR